MIFHRIEKMARSMLLAIFVLMHEDILGDSLIVVAARTSISQILCPKR